MDEIRWKKRGFCGIIEVEDKTDMKELRIKLSDKIHRELKAESARVDKTMTEVVVELLRRWLKEERNIEV